MRGLWNDNASGLHVPTQHDLRGSYVMRFGGLLNRFGLHIGTVPER